MIEKVVMDPKLLRRMVIGVMVTAFLFVGAAFSFGTDGDGDPASGGHIALQVYYDDVMLREFTMADLWKIAENEGGGQTRKYDYSGYNTFPAAKPLKDVEGPTVEGILNDALSEKGTSVAELDDDQLIEFSQSGDNNREFFLKGQLMARRYCYPSDGTPEDRVQVPAVISLEENGKTFDKNPDVGRLVFGQIAPDEQNHAAYVKYLATPEHTGRITIYSLDRKPAETWNPIVSTDKGKGGEVETGTQLTFDCSVNSFPSGGGPRYWVHYTTDGSEPDINSEMYNWNSFNHGNTSEKFSKPVMGEGLNTIKVVVTGYGKKNSEVSTFEFTGSTPTQPTQPTTQPTTQTTKPPAVTPPSAPTGVKATATGYQSIRINWKRPGGASGYQIYRSTKKASGYQLAGTVKSGSTQAFTNSSSSVKTGTTYYYKVRAFKTDSRGNRVYGKYSSVASAKTKLNRPAIASIKASGKTITLKWKKIPGATGYQVYRATKKTGRYTLVKTLKGNGKISFSNKNLKKNRTYYYKVRAYRTVSGKNVYSSFSAIKYRKIK